MTNTRDAELVIRAVLADASLPLIIAELERRGWERGMITIADETYDMLLCERDAGELTHTRQPPRYREALPFDVGFEPDWDDLGGWDYGETMSA